VSAPDEPLETLRTLLRSAVKLTRDLAADPLFVRLLRVFAAMPRDDRETVVSMLEREVGIRRLTRTMEAVTGVALRPNPNARLYVRAVGRHATAAQADHESMVLATLGGARSMQLLLGPDLQARWVAAVREAFAALDSAERAQVGCVLREMLAVLAQCERGTAAPA
jgi:hypothetical protein